MCERAKKEPSIQIPLSLSPFFFSLFLSVSLCSLLVQAFSHEETHTLHITSDTHSVTHAYVSHTLDIDTRET